MHLTHSPLAALLVMPAPRHAAPRLDLELDLERLRDTRDAYQRLQNVDIIRVADGSSAPLASLWASEERAALFFFRSFG